MASRAGEGEGPLGGLWTDPDPGVSRLEELLPEPCGFRLAHAIFLGPLQFLAGPEDPGWERNRG